MLWYLRRKYREDFSNIYLDAPQGNIQIAICF
jgi:hypothetical protein